MEIDILASAFGILAFLLIWTAAYIFKEIIVYAEKLKRKSYGSHLILPALPLLLLQPVISAYYTVFESSAVPPALQLLTTGSLLLASLLILMPVYLFSKISRLMGIPIVALFFYSILYLAIYASLLVDLSEPLRVSQVLWMIGELALGAGLLLLSIYTVDSGELKIGVGGRAFVFTYGLSSLMLLMGMLLPIDAGLRIIFLQNTAPQMIGIPTPTFRLVAFLLLTIAGILAIAGMLNFRRMVQRFLSRIGSKEVMLKG